MNTESKWYHRELSQRGIGVLMIAGGIFLTGIGVVYPLMEAAKHVSRIDIHIKVAVLIPYLFVMGALQVFLPEWSAKHLGSPQNPSRLAFFIAIPLILIGLGIYFAIQHHLKSLGYSG